MSQLESMSIELLANQREIELAYEIDALEFLDNIGLAKPMTFIEAVLSYTKASESPRRYYYWSALAAVASVVKSNVYLDKFYYKLYPNIYVLLVGRSGLRKGPPVNLTRALVSEVNNTRIFAGRVSIQGVISELSKARTKKEGGPPQTEASGLLCASEFASFIIQDPSALTILTDLYDGHYNPEWSYMLRNSPTEKLTKPCLTLIGASNESHIKDAIPQNAIGGGFVARTFIIYSNKKSGINALTVKPKDSIPIEQLYTMLREIGKASGPFKWSEPGRRLYEAWYQQYQELEQLEDDTTGTMERLHDHILKTAMLISLSRKVDLVLEYSDIEEAIRACQDFVPGAKRISLGTEGKAPSAPGTAVLLKELLTNSKHEISKPEALAKFWAHFDVFDLDRIAESLFAQKAITITLRPGDNGQREQWYILNPKVLERYQSKSEKEAEK